MTSIKIYDINGKVIREHKIPITFEPRESDEQILARALRRQLANARRNYAKVKTRGEVTTGRSKPWRQKGTGRARQGSTNNPIWSGGGVAFGPRGQRNFTEHMNKKERKRAMQVALMKIIAQEGLVVVDGLKLDKPSTKTGAGIIKKLPIGDVNTLFLAGNEEDILFLSFRNIGNVECLPSERLNGFSLAKNQKVLATLKAYENIEKVWLS